MCYIWFPDHCDKLDNRRQHVLVLEETSAMCYLDLVTPVRGNDHQSHVHNYLAYAVQRLRFGLFYLYIRYYLKSLVCLLSIHP